MVYVRRCIPVSIALLACACIAWALHAPSSADTRPAGEFACGNAEVLPCGNAEVLACANDEVLIGHPPVVAKQRDVALRGLKAIRDVELQLEHSGLPEAEVRRRAEAAAQEAYRQLVAEARAARGVARPRAEPACGNAESAEGNAEGVSGHPPAVTSLR
jgi:hypothetical protein